MLYLSRTTIALLAVPALALAAPAERSGEQIVQAQCTKCHAAGVDGAPRLGERQEWIARLTKGFDATVGTAIKGHGSMPARGGMADLTDPEIRAAVAYMINYGLPAPSAGPTLALAEDPHRKIIGDMEILIGLMPAELLRARADPAEAAMHGGIPSGKGYYHVNVALHDKTTGRAIPNARVSARVATPLIGETKRLRTMTINKAPSYGNYFRMHGNDPHVVTLTIQRPDLPGAVEAKFDVRF